MIQRVTNWSAAWRVDVAHLRAQESSVAADFDVLGGSVLTAQQAMVVSGFNVNMTGAVGGPASALQLNTAGGVLIHPLASESGSLFTVPSSRAVETLVGTNSRVSGSFSPSQTNYMGIDLRRAADSTTVDTVQFLDTATLSEIAEIVPLARTLDYLIVISLSDFSATPTLVPIAKVTTDSSNNVTAVQDARPMFSRLGSGGSVPNIQAAYSWPGGRAENLTGDVFSGGDKAINSLRNWMSAAMSRIQEIGGGAYWYSPTADRNVVLARTGAVMTDGEWFTWDGTNLTWQGLYFVFDNSGGWYNQIADQTSSSPGLTDLADGQCIYVDIDRTQNLGTGGTGSALIALKGTLTTLGASVVPGARQVVAWRKGTQVYTRNSAFPVGATFNAATTSALGLVKLLQTPGAPSAPVVLNQDANGGLTFSASGGNRTAIVVTGNGSGAGVSGTGGATNGTGVAGFGGAGGNATGVLGTANAAGGTGVEGSGGSATGTGVAAVGGNAGGPALVATASGTTTVDGTIVAKNSAGQTRSIIADRNGLPTGGPVWKFEEYWNVGVPSLSSNTNPIATGLPKWRFDQIDSSTMTSGSDTLMPGQHVLISTPSTASAWGQLSTVDRSGGNPSIPMNYTFGQFVMEWAAAVTPSNAGTANNVSAFMGVFNINGGNEAALSTTIAMFQKTNASANWFVGVGLSGTFSGFVDTGVVATDTGGSGYQWFKIEIQGSAAPGALAVNFYINGALVHSFTNGTQIPNTALTMAFEAKNPGGYAGGSGLVVGPVHAVMNLFASPATG